MIVPIGLTPEAVRETALASPIQTPGTSWSSPSGFATLVPGVRGPSGSSPSGGAVKMAELAAARRECVVDRIDERVEVVAALPRSGRLRPMLTIAGPPPRRLVEADQLAPARAGSCGCPSSSSSR